MTVTGAAVKIELGLVAVGPDGIRRDVRVVARADAPTRLLLAALAGEVGAEPDAHATRRGDELPADAPLAELELRHGDEIRFGEPIAVERRGVLDVVVLGGPDSGRRIPLQSGSHRIGRSTEVSLDDPALSSEHLVLTIAEDGLTTIADAGSRNGTLVEGVSLAAGETRELRLGEVVQAGRTLLALEPPAVEVPEWRAGASGRVRFNRPPRVQRRLEEAIRPFGAPPTDPHRSRLPLGASLIPLALGVALYLWTKLPTMLLFSLLSPVMAISTYIEDRRSGRKGFEQTRGEYREELAALATELEAERRDEANRRRTAFPPAVELTRRARRLESTLWERRLEDRDFLELRVGSAELPSLLRVRLEAGGSAEIRREVEELSEWYATVPAVPVTVGAATHGVVGLCGPREPVESLARWLVAQAAALHSPRDLTISAALDPSSAADWDWLKWLPHVAPTGEGRVGMGPAAARLVLEDIARTVSSRRLEADAGFGATSRRVRPHVLLVLDESVAPGRALVAEVLAGAGEHGVSVLWLGRERRDLPGETGAIVELAHESARLTLVDTSTGVETHDVTADALSAERARELALALAPVEDDEAGVGGGTVPASVSLLALLGEDDLDADRVAARWHSRDGGLGAIVAGAAGGPFWIDLRSDGPHGLVAGMTGAGKSELLQTLIASLALAHPPDRLAFLLVDYKGGAAFKECVDLPHTVGLVTDLDAHLTRRALASLNAELQSRERILRAADAKDLVDLEARDPSGAPPSLLIAIDEFATLAKEVPDFVEGIVDVAQRGRSLGVHLLLATQRPGGVVSENIRANTNLRIALRVNEPAESSDVIGVPDAARISRGRPGRAYARTGHGELTEIQAGYVGSPAAEAALDVTVSVSRFPLVEEADPVDAGPDGDSELTQIVAAAAEAARREGIATAPSPWLEPLPAMLPAEETESGLGLIDEPERQLQRPLELDLEQDGSVLVYGASGSGKTAFLRTLALSLGERHSPEELHVYGLDFATRGLLALEGLPHVGSIVGGEDEERTERLFSFLRTNLEHRKHLLAGAGVFSISDYHQRENPEPIPRILVLLDGYAGFASAFERVNLGALVDALPRLVADGRPLGLHFAITADRRGAVPNALAGIVPAKLVLRMADEDEFASLGVPLKSVRGVHLPPGRGFLPNGIEFQVASEGDIAARAAALAAQYPNLDVPPIEPLPTSVPPDELARPETPWTAALGLGDAELETVMLDLSDRHFLITGPYRSGRSTALATIVRSLQASTPGLELHLLAPRRTPLSALECWASISEGTAACDDAAVRLEALSAEFPERPVLVVIDDAEELAETLGAAPLETVVRRGRDAPIRVLAVAERQAAQRAFSGWLREIRKEEHGLLLAPDLDVDGDILGTRLPRRSSPVFPPGRGYLVERGSVGLVQVAAEPAPEPGQQPG